MCIARFLRFFIKFNFYLDSIIAQVNGLMKILQFEGL
jgi:hypothetical protein